MAKAAAKKAAAAREAAAKTYFPIVVAINAIYLLLRLVYQRNSLTIYGGLMTVLLVAGSGISYKGILEDHAHSIPTKGSSDALAGGASLDLLGLLMVVQYGTIFISDKLYWLLAVIPVWGGWKLYSTFFGSKGGAGGLMPSMQGNPPESNDGAMDGEAAEKAKEKRQKRAERRRQKWS